MNQIVIMGRLTRDPELRHTPNGVPVVSFTLAVDRGFAPKDGGERQTDFIDIVAWRNTAEFVARYFVKGQMAAIVGRLQIRNWEDKDGNRRRSAEVVAESAHFTESKRAREAAFGKAAIVPSFDPDSLPAAPGLGFEEVEADDGGLPF